MIRVAVIVATVVTVGAISGPVSADDRDRLEQQRDGVNGKHHDARRGLDESSKNYAKASDALKSLNDFTEKHETLAKAAGVAIVGIGVGLTTLGPILTLAGAGLAAYSAIQLRAAASAAPASPRSPRQIANEVPMRSAS